MALAVVSAEDLTAVLAVLKTVANFILEIAVSLAQTVVSEPLLIIPIGVVMLRTAISIFRSLF